MGVIGTDPARPRASSRQLRSAVSPVPKCEGHPRIDHAAHMIGWNQIVQHRRKQRPLTTTFSLDIAHRWRCLINLASSLVLREYFFFKLPNLSQLLQGVLQTTSEGRAFHELTKLHIG